MKPIPADTYSFFAITCRFACLNCGLAISNSDMKLDDNRHLTKRTKWKVEGILHWQTIEFKCKRCRSVWSLDTLFDVARIKGTLTEHAAAIIEDKRRYLYEQKEAS